MRSATTTRQHSSTARRRWLPFAYAVAARPRPGRGHQKPGRNQEGGTDSRRGRPIQTPLAARPLVQSALQETTAAIPVIEQTHRAQQQRLRKATRAVQQELDGLQRAIHAIDDDLTL